MRADFANVLPVDLDLPRFQPQARAVALRTSRISAITAQKNADVQLVFLPLQILEESAHAQELSFPIQNKFLLRWLELCPGTSSGIPACLAKRFISVNTRPVFRLVPRIDRSFAQRFRLVRNHQVEIEVNRVAESLASRTRAIGIVERKQPRLRLLVAQIAVLAFEALGEPQLPRLARHHAAANRKSLRPTRDKPSPPHPQCASAIPRKP